VRKKHIQSNSPLGKARHDVRHGLSDVAAVDLVVKNWEFPKQNTDKSPEAWAKLKESIPIKLAKQAPNGYKTDKGVRKRTEGFQEIEKATNLIVEALEAGGTIDMAAAYAGLRPKDLQYWLQLGYAKPKSVYAVFLKLIQQAIAKCDITDLGRLGSASQMDWRAAEARLKLRGFGKSSASDAENQKSITVNIQNFNVEGSLPAPKVKLLSQEEIEDAFEQIPQQTGVSEQCESAETRGETDQTGGSDSILSETESDFQPQEGEISAVIQRQE